MTILEHPRTVEKGHDPWTAGPRRDWMDQWDSRKSPESTLLLGAPDVVQFSGQARRPAAEETESIRDFLGALALVLGVFAAAFGVTWLTDEYRWLGAIIPLLGMAVSVGMYLALRSRFRTTGSRD